VTIDSLRASSVGSHSKSGIPLTPNLDRIGASGISFPRAFSHGGGTPEAFPSIMSSVCPPITKEDYGIRGRRTLASILREEGYQTIGIHSNPYLSELYGFDNGFDIFRDMGVGNGFSGQRSRVADTVNLLGRGRPPICNAEDLSREVRTIVRKMEGSRQVFLWTHFMDTHFPYLPPAFISSHRRLLGRFFWPIFLSQGYHKNFARPDSRIVEYYKRVIRGYYDSSVRYVDACVGQMLSFLRARFHNPLMIITADHGEQFWEHGIFGHAFLFDEIIQVPFIWYDREKLVHRISPEQIVGHSSILPTVAGLLNIQGKNHYFGPSLIDGVSRESHIFSSSVDEPFGAKSVSVRSAKWKYMEIRDWTGSRMTCALYDLTIDPGETRNLVNLKPEIAAYFSEEISGTFCDTMSSVAKGPMSEEDERLLNSRLRSLGYM
jgi:arylsulfatase A-like enzyme